MSAASIVGRRVRWAASKRCRSAALRAALAAYALYAGSVHGASLALAAGAAEDASVTAIAYRWDAPLAWVESPARRLVWAVEVDAINLHARHGRHFGVADIVAIGATPNLRVEWPRNGLVPYAALGIGGHLLSHTQLRGGPSFGTAFQFGEWLEGGLRFGAGRAFELALRIEHLSNADIKLPNDGITFGVVRFGWYY